MNNLVPIEHKNHKALLKSLIEMAERENSPNVSIREASELLSKEPDTIKAALRNKSFPIGFAMKTKPNRWTYCIPREALERLMRGERA